MKRDPELEATIVEKFAAVEPMLDERGRREIEGGEQSGRVRRPGAGRPRVETTQPGVKKALEGLVDPMTRSDPCSPLGWGCKSRAKLVEAGWRVSSTTVGRLLHELGYSLQSVGKSREVVSHPERKRSSNISMRRAMCCCSASSP